jgi:hypothetical protein
MKILFTSGVIDVEGAAKEVAKYAAHYDANPGVANGTSFAEYVMPRESNGQEGYIRFPLEVNERAPNSSSELHIYFSPRASVPYRINFVYRDEKGSAGFDVYSQIWTHRVAVNLAATGVVKAAIAKASGSDPLDG